MKKYYKHIAVLIVLLILFAGLLTNCMLNNIKDTDSILHEDYKYLSLVHGAIAWETGVIRRLYDFGQIFPVYKEDKRGRKIIENYENPDQTSQMVRLIHAFFYRVPGSTGAADFGVTTQLALSDEVTVKLIAEIIVQCEQLRQQRGQFKQAAEYVEQLIKVIAESGWLTKLDKKTTQAGLEKKIKDVQEKPWNENAATALVSMCKLFAKNLEKELGEDIVNKLEEHRQAAEKFFKLNKETTNNLRKLLKPEVFKKRENVESFVVEALNESDSQNSDALYPPHTVEMILLAFVYKKYSYNRNVLKAFYDDLNTQFGDKILLQELHEQWVKDSFAPVTQQQALEIITSIFVSKDLMESINQHFAEFVYNAFQIRSFPAPVGYADAVYEYEKGKKTAAFADCMCNTMRNFINLYAYDAEQNKFILEKLLATMNLSAVNPTLADFLKKFSDSSTASLPEAHDAWLILISNVPYVAYNRMVDGTTGQSVKALDTGKGYIVIPENERSKELLDWLKTNGYQVLEKNQYGYELQPSVKNIILVLDHLLALNLFADAGLAKEFKRPDFIKEYFLKFCSVVKATGFLSTQKNAEQGEPDKDFDALDYTESKIYTTIDLTEIICEFITYSGHGELKLIEAEEDQGNERELVSLLEKLSNFEVQPSLSFLITNIRCRQKINFDNLNNLEYVYINLFTVPLENTDFLRLIVDKVFSIIPHTTSLKIKTAIKNLLLRLVEKQPDIVQQQKQKIHILKLFMQSISNDDMRIGATDLVSSFKQGVEAAASALVEGPSFNKYELLSLFKDLFEKNQGFAEAIHAAAKVIGHQDIRMRRISLDLFKELVSRNQGFTEAMRVAAKGITDPDEYLKDLAIELVQALVEKDQGFTEAIEVAVKGVADQDLRAAALDLFTLLVSKNKGFAEALSAGKSVITKEQRPDIRGAAIRLFKELIVKIPDETKKVIQNHLNDPNIDLGNYEKKVYEEMLA